MPLHEPFLAASASYDNLYFCSQISNAYASFVGPQEILRTAKNVRPIVVNDIAMLGTAEPYLLSKRDYWRELRRIHLIWAKVQILTWVTGFPLQDEIERNRASETCSYLSVANVLCMCNQDCIPLNRNTTPEMQSNRSHAGCSISQGCAWVELAVKYLFQIGLKELCSLQSSPCLSEDIHQGQTQLYSRNSSGHRCTNEQLHRLPPAFLQCT